MNNKFIAIHVRRTDLDNHLLGFRKKYLKIEHQMKIFLNS